MTKAVKYNFIPYNIRYGSISIQQNSPPTKSVLDYFAKSVYRILAQKPQKFLNQQTSATHVFLNFSMCNVDCTACYLIEEDLQNIKVSAQFQKGRKIPKFNQPYAFTNVLVNLPSSVFEEKFQKAVNSEITQTEGLSFDRTYMEQYNYYYSLIAVLQNQKDRYVLREGQEKPLTPNYQVLCGIVYQEGMLHIRGQKALTTEGFKEWIRNRFTEIYELETIEYKYDPENEQKTFKQRNLADILRQRSIALDCGLLKYVDRTQQSVPENYQSPGRQAFILRDVMGIVDKLFDIFEEFQIDGNSPDTLMPLLTKVNVVRKNEETVDDDVYVATYNRQANPTDEFYEKQYQELQTQKERAQKPE